MANEQNLRNIDEYNKTLTAEERTRNARKAGEASGEARRERKLFRELFNEMLDETHKDDSGHIVTTRELIVRKAVKFLADETTMQNAKQLDARDYIRVMEFIRDTVGEKPTDKVELTIDDESAREIDEYFAGKNH